MGKDRHHRAAFGRIWNYWLGGKDNYTVDRVAGDAFRELYPDITVVARAVRAFLARAVRHLAAEADVRQFLDVGTGLPTALPGETFPGKTLPVHDVPSLSRRYPPLVDSPVRY